MDLDVSCLLVGGDADSRRAGEIYAIYLVPAAWDEGIGRQLMAAALGRLGEAGSGQIILWVLDSNARARRFYEAGGWLDDGAVKLPAPSPATRASNCPVR